MNRTDRKERTCRLGGGEWLAADQTCVVMPQGLEGWVRFISDQQPRDENELPDRIKLRRLRAARHNLQSSPSVSWLRSWRFPSSGDSLESRMQAELEALATVGAATLFHDEDLAPRDQREMSFTNGERLSTPFRKLIQNRLNAMRLEKRNRPPPHHALTQCHLNWERDQCEAVPHCRWNAASCLLRFDEPHEVETLLAWTEDARRAQDVPWLRLMNLELWRHDPELDPQGAIFYTDDEVNFLVDAILHLDADQLAARVLGALAYRDLLRHQPRWREWLMEVFAVAQNPRRTTPLARNQLLRLLDYLSFIDDEIVEQYPLEEGGMPMVEQLEQIKRRMLEVLHPDIFGLPWPLPEEERREERFGQPEVRNPRPPKRPRLN